MSSTGTGSKRKADDGARAAKDGPSKKQRTFDARTISSQSNVAPVPNSLTGLPTSIDVEKFAEARSFEIKAMDSAMKAARAAATQRVWQTLPRHLRRRAASHDFRRVPKRLHERAKQELEGRKHVAQKPKSRLGKARRISRTDSLLRRQRDKSWLETHIWHAKRMKMENRWGYRLAMHPTEKAFRPSYRAAIHGCIIHDASYFSCIELKGKQSILKNVLEICCNPSGLGPGAARYISGARRYDTEMYHCGEYPFNLIGPASILWCPLDASPTVQSNSGSKGKGKEPERTSIRQWRQQKTKGGAFSNPASSSKSQPSDLVRQVWVQVHPAMFDAVQASLQTAVATVLSQVNQDASTKSEEVEISDLRKQINAFDLVGPKSTSILQGILNVIRDGSTNSDEVVDTWKRIRDSVSTAALPRGIVLSMTVHDPRLSFPPVIRSATDLANGSPFLLNPSPTLASSRLWAEDVRNIIGAQKVTNAELNKRRSQNTVPGTRLSPRADDARIPIILIQRSVGSPFSSVSSPTPASSSSATNMHGWTLLVPAGWAMPFLTSLVFTGARIAGQRERRVQQFECENGLAFPEDYVTTQAFGAHAREVTDKDKARWERTPPAKRVNMDSVEPGQCRAPNRWNPDWEALNPANSNPSAPTTETVALIPTQPDLLGDATERIPQDTNKHDPQHPTSPRASLSSWLLRGPDSMAMTDELLSIPLDGAATALLSRLNSARQKRNLGPLSTAPDTLLQSALINVSVNPVLRGSPEDFSMLYAPKESALDGLIASVKSKNIDPLDTMQSSVDSIMGYCTSGNFSLSRGRGHAIGTVSLHSYLALARRMKELGSSPLVLVRNRGEETCRPAVLQLLA